MTAGATVAAFVGMVAEWLPPLSVLWLALAVRCQGLDALAVGDPVAGLGPGLFAAAVARRGALGALAAPAGRLIPPACWCAAATLGVGLGELVRGLAVGAR